MTMQANRIQDKTSLCHIRQYKISQTRAIYDNIRQYKRIHDNTIQDKTMQDKIIQYTTIQYNARQHMTI